MYHPLDVRFNFPPGEWNRLEELATESELSFSSYIKKIIHDHLQKPQLTIDREKMQAAGAHPAELFLQERCALEPDGYAEHQEMWEECSLYYRDHYPDKKPRYLGGRRKLFALVDAIPGVDRDLQPNGRLKGFRGIMVLLPPQDQGGSSKSV